MYGIRYTARVGACGPGEGELKIVDWLYTHVPFSSTARYSTAYRAVRAHVCVHMYMYTLYVHSQAVVCRCTCSRAQKEEIFGAFFQVYLFASPFVSINAKVNYLYSLYLHLYLYHNNH